MILLYDIIMTIAMAEQAEWSRYSLDVPQVGGTKPCEGIGLQGCSLNSTGVTEEKRYLRVTALCHTR